MARLVDNAGPLTGGALASRLHGHTHNGDEAATALVSRVLGNVCAPLYDMLGRWVLHGELHDPYSEFFVGHRAGVPAASVWQDGYFLQVSMLPTYLSHTVAQKVLVIGKSINFIKLCSALLAQRNAERSVHPNLPTEAKNVAERKLARIAMRRREDKLRKHFKTSRDSVTGRRREPKEGGGGDDKEEEEEGDNEEGDEEEEEEEKEAVGQFTMAGHAAAAASAAELIGPALSYAGKGRLVESITALSRTVDSRLLTLIRSKYRIETHLHALKQFLLLSQGDFVICLMDTVGPELRKRANQLYRHNLTGMLESALRGSNAQYLPADVLDRVGVKLLQPGAGDTGWEVFSLDYLVDPPLSAVVHQEAMGKYRQVFHLLWRLKRVEWTLSSAWRQLLVFSHSRGSLDGSKRLQKVLHRCSLNRARMLHVVTTINTYLMFEVLDSEWQALLEKMATKVTSLDDLIATHDIYLDNVLQRALLTAADEALYLQLQTMLQSVLRFCSLEETLIADAMAALARKQSRADSSRRDQEAGQWAHTSTASSSGDVNTSAEDPDSYDGVPAYVVHRIDEAVRDYSLQFDSLMTMLDEQGDSVRDMNKFLALRLDFNEYHAREKSQGKSGVVTSTPPVNGGSTADVAQMAHAAALGRSRLSFNREV
jgi:gamma-tubulin complex component 3